MSLDKEDVFGLMVNLEQSKSCGELRMKYQHGKIKRVCVNDSAITTEEIEQLKRPLT